MEQNLFSAPDSGAWETGKQNGQWPWQELRYMKQSSKIMESVAQKKSRSKKWNLHSHRVSSAGWVWSFSPGLPHPTCPFYQRFLSVRVRLLGNWSKQAGRLDSGKERKRGQQPCESVLLFVFVTFPLAHLSPQTPHCSGRQSPEKNAGMVISSKW